MSAQGNRWGEKVKERTRMHVAVRVDNLEVDHLILLKDVGVGLRTVQRRNNRLIAHREGRKEGGNLGHLEGNVVERSSVDSIVL